MQGLILDIRESSARAVIDRVVLDLRHKALTLNAVNLRCRHHAIQKRIFTRCVVPPLPINEYVRICLRPQETRNHQIAAFAALNLSHGICEFTVECGRQHKHGRQACCLSNVWSGINVDPESIGET